MRPRQNGRHFSDDIFNSNEKVWNSINISLKFVPNGPINNIPTLDQIMAWRRAGDKPFCEPMMVRLPTHICVTLPQWFIRQVHLTGASQLRRTYLLSNLNCCWKIVREAISPIGRGTQSHRVIIFFWQRVLVIFGLNAVYSVTRLMWNGVLWPIKLLVSLCSKCRTLFWWWIFSSSCLNQTCHF